MNKSVFLILMSLLLTTTALPSQEPNARVIFPLKIQPGVPAVEIHSTTNASQLGVPFVIGYQFTVTTPVVLNTLGAVLQGSTSQPVFGSLPASLQVNLWDNAQNLLSKATVSAGDPLIGHFNYHAVNAISLLPGVTYTIAALVPAGYSVLSDVPAITTGPAVTYVGGRSIPSSALVFPSGDIIGRNSYFGAGFTYLNAISARGPVPIEPGPIHHPLPIVAVPATAPVTVPVTSPITMPTAAQDVDSATTPVVVSSAPAGGDQAAPVHDLKRLVKEAERKPKQRRRSRRDGTGPGGLLPSASTFCAGVFSAPISRATASRRVAAYCGKPRGGTPARRESRAVPREAAGERTPALPGSPPRAS